MYNYDRLSNFTSLITEGLLPGSLFPSCVVTTTAGQPITLGDTIQGPWVLETASLSCPAYAQHVEAMQNLVKRFPTLQFIVLYVREAYPNRRLNMHRSVVEKLDRAVALRLLRHESRNILVDDLQGSTHLHLGGWPNMLYIVDGNGYVAYRANWNNAATTSDVLEQFTRTGTIPTQIRFSRRPFSVAALPWLVKNVGYLAAWDHIKAIPSLVALERRQRDGIKELA